jgi:hypothetical protein
VKGNWHSAPLHPRREGSITAVIGKVETLSKMRWFVVHPSSGGMEENLGADVAEDSYQKQLVDEARETVCHPGIRG